MLLAFDWTQLAQQTVIGLSTGGTWALLALALVLIYRSTGVINFAQGEMAMFSIFIAWSLVDHGLSFWAAFFLTIAISFVGGIAIERVVIRPVERAPALTVAIVTIGLVLPRRRRFALDLELGDADVPERVLDAPDRRRGSRVLDPGSRQHRRLARGRRAALAVLPLHEARARAARGRGEPGRSRLVGIRVSWMLALGWGLAAALGAVSGMLTAPALGCFDQNVMQAVLLYAFAAAVLGGLDSPLGAVVGSLVLGVMINLIGTYVGLVGTDLRPPFALAVILVVLLVKPTGLFGRTVVRRV